MSIVEKKNHQRQTSDHRYPDSTLANNSLDGRANGHAKNDPRSVNSLPRQTQQPLSLSEDISRQRRRVEFVYPKNDDVHRGKAYQFHKHLPQQGTVETKVDEEGEKTNGKSKQTEKLVLALLRLEDDDSKTVDSGQTTSDNGKSESRHLSGLSVEDAVRDKVGCRPRANSTDGELNLPQRGLCDERAVLESHRWTIYGDKKELPPRGFQNLGNTCFLNSTLQCLAYLPPFCQSLLALMQSSPVAMSSQSVNGKKDASSPGKRITWMLRSLFQQIHSGKDTNANNITHALAPRAIVNALPSIGTCGSRHGYKFRLGRQEDAHEFLVHLLDAMQDGELRAAGINQHVSGWRDRLPVPRLDETTFVHRIFGGYLRSQVQCTACGYVSNTYDPFLDLALEVSRQTSTSIAAALAEFTKKETLDSQNRWKCSGCHKHVCATKQLTVFRPPLALCIQLKRFSFGSYGGNNAFSSGGVWNRGGRSSGNKIFNHNMLGRGGSKITKPIEFPSDLNLPLSDKRNCAYSLTGVVIHVGGSASSGHYTAYVKKPLAGGGFQWFHMDDSFVEQVSEKQVLRQKDAYVLFYCRKEVKLEFPAPPKVSMSTAEAKQLAKVRAKAAAAAAAIAASGRLEVTLSESSEVQRDAVKLGVPPSSLDSVASDTNSTSNSSLLSTAKSLPRPREGSSFCTSSSTESTGVSSKKRLDPPGRILKPLEPIESDTSEDSDSDSDSSVATNSASGKSNHSSSVVTTKSDLSANAFSTDNGSQKSKSSQGASAATINMVLSGGLGQDSPVSSDNTRVGVPEAATKQGVGETTRMQVDSTKTPSKQMKLTSTDAGSSSSDDSSSSSEDSSSSSSSDDSSSSSSDYSSDSSDDDESLSESEKVSKRSDSVAGTDKEGSSPSTTRSISAPTKATKHGKAGGTLARIAAASAAGSLASDSSDGKLTSVASATASESCKAPKSTEGKDASRQPRVVLDRGGALGKLEVILGNRSTKGTAWKPNVQNHDKEHELLGNRAIGRWDDDDDNDVRMSESDDVKTKSSNPSVASRSSDYRAQVVKRMEDSERSRKRKMHLDRWDAHLDQGKQKKVKSKQNSDQQDILSDPKKNVFQRIQSGLQRMNKGRAKGLFHLKKHPQHRNDNKSKKRPHR